MGNQECLKAYLDVETSFNQRLTVVGIYRPDAGILQLYGNGINGFDILSFLKGVDFIVTYNGERFDLKILAKELGLDLMNYFGSIDLMYECWRHKLYGGLKAVERQLGIYRETSDICGYDAMSLWERYVRLGDLEALRLLLDYNREDVLNLITLEKRLKQLSEISY